MLVTVGGYWWQNIDVGDIFWMLTVIEKKVDIGDQDEQMAKQHWCNRSKADDCVRWRSDES